MPLVPINDPLQPATLVDANTPGTPIRAGLRRKLLRTTALMAAVLDFDDGPWATPDAYHSHPHEQISYVADGEILFLVEGDPPRHLRAGDLFSVPGHRPHTIQLLSRRARLVDLFHPVREEFL